MEALVNRTQNIYKQKFIENFNVAVTASSLKWHHMEPEKGKVNFLTTDNILTWADENQLPLRGHEFLLGNILRTGLGKSAY